MFYRDCLACIVVAGTLNVGQSQEPRPLADFANFKTIKSAVISPDGKTVACLVGTPSLKENRTRTALWLVATANGDMERVEFETDALDQVLWSPKGDRMLVQGTLAADKQQWLWIVEFPSKESKRLVPVDRGNHYLAHQGANLAWSPGGDAVAYLAADTPPPAKDAEPLVVERIQYKTRTAFSDNRRSQLWNVDVASGKIRQVTKGKNDVHSIDWSPTGKEIAACSNRESDPDASWNNELIMVDASDGTETQITKTPGNEMTPVFSPDANQIAYLMTNRRLTTIDSVAEDAHVWIYDRQTKKTYELAQSLDRRCSHLCWGQGNNQIFCLVRDRGNVAIARIPRFERAAAAVIKTPGNVLDFSLTRWNFDSVIRSNRGCCVISSPTKPAEIFLFDKSWEEPAQFAYTQLTHLNSLAAERWQFIAPQHIEFKSFDNTPIEGWLTIPRGASKDKKCPVILNIHGGPHGMHSNAFSAQTQLLAERGYAVLALNPRGSTGYGQKFADGCYNDWGGGDYKDLIAGLEFALKKYPELDSERLGVTGGSYGGYMTNWAITQDNRFKAAVSYAGLSNLISFYATSLYQDLIHVEFGGQPWEKYDILWDRSPLKHIKNAKTPTLILHGEADFDVHITQSEELYTALKWRGVETVFVRYPRQGHGATEPRQQLDMLERTVAWFDRHLTPRKD